MQASPIRVHALLFPALVVASIAGNGRTQERSFEPIPDSADVKTAPEGAGPLPPSAPRPALAPASVDPASKPRGPRQHALDPRAPVGAARGIDHTRMHYDTPGDGSLWARGARYKASVDAGGVTYYPMLGPAQPEHYPLRLTPDRLTRGGELLDVSCTSAAVRTGNRVELDHGLFVEAYEFAPESVEQLFVFRSLPGEGELVLHLPIACKLPASEERECFVFQSDLGRVTYGRAVAIDANGRRIDAPTELEDGAISIRVDARFLATATFPLTIDPVVSTFPIDTTSYNDSAADVAYDATTARWLTVYSELEVGGDVDVYYEMLDAAGNGLWGGYVNSNTDSWTTASCANLASATQFLVACTVNPGSSSTIKGRTIEADVFSISADLQISGSESGPKRWPSVGGDPYLFGGSFYCVAYERIYDAFSDWDVLVRLVGPDGVPQPVIYLSNSGGTEDTAPAVSKSNGGSTWTIAWGRLITGLELQVWAGRVRFDGFVVNTPFALSVGSYEDQLSVSTPLIGSQRTMVVWQRDYGTDHDIVATVLDGATILEQRNLSLMESTWFLENQISPSVDSDGQHFLVAYSESYVGSATDYDIYVSDYYLSGNALGLAQPHVNLAYTTLYEGGPVVASRYGAGGANRRYLAAWTKRTTSTNSDVMGALFDGVEGGAAQPFCFGDGMSGACPCGNNGASGRGCASSANASGGLLSLTGNASTWNDTALLTASGLPATSVAIFLSSTATSSAAFLGDGLGCLSGTVLRLGTKTAAGGVVSYPGPSDGLLHNRGNVPLDGESRLYQAWYRNATNFCTPATSNVTNGVLVSWAR